jgi:hypothetical protein
LHRKKKLRDTIIGESSATKIRLPKKKFLGIQSSMKVLQQEEIKKLLLAFLLVSFLQQTKKVRVSFS